MIICPNCDYENPDGATICERCNTPLPATAPTTTSCPHCGAEIPVDATFCGQCGNSLTPVATESEGGNNLDPTKINTPITAVNPGPTPGEIPEQTPGETPEQTQSNGPSAAKATQIQKQAKLLHVQTHSNLDLPETLPVIHIGRANNEIPPDIDVSPFPDSDVVSRVHADIRLEGENYFVEDMGSANGTYINGQRLLQGNRHLLKTGDRIALGKQDKVSFIFNIS